MKSRERLTQGSSPFVDLLDGSDSDAVDFIQRCTAADNFGDSIGSHGPHAFFRRRLPDLRRVGSGLHKSANPLSRCEQLEDTQTTLVSSVAALTAPTAFGDVGQVVVSQIPVFDF